MLNLLCLFFCVKDGYLDLGKIRQDELFSTSVPAFLGLRCKNHDEYQQNIPFPATDLQANQPVEWDENFCQSHDKGQLILESDFHSHKRLEQDLK